ncbi:MAG: DUF2061 domain-containing protein [Candidatus Thermoplasmatota archaeon]|nr:DUF2061 domain-containing protein [Candidatus Thermoplasmatota archaeon]
MEGKARSIAKSISYRIICIISLSIVTYAITGDPWTMTYIVVVFQTIQIILFYLHERIWSRVRWGYARK